ncbi:class I SAM-dependent methyltransferase [Paenibacillus tundrae]|uniref:class I SAM-dependent methyltransferase n=1 Tax=Paenibacillus tundrae TaxID=528187 RepID=UPI0022A995DF|nr:class I SAM-dependent methyltransferase [Paenibacillus tundrae]MCZ1264081.1 class I SAM-dependent methyltransferase [Paenibacillus tundrae]
MLDKNKVDSFFKRRAKISDPELATHYKKDDTINFDINLIEKYVNTDSKILDLGCGPGRITNILESKVSYIKAVDNQKEFLSSCTNSPKVEKVVAHLADFQDDNKYDAILLFGVLNYFNNDEVEKIYNNCNSMLKMDGVLIVKHACGIFEDVIIDKFSEQINDWYHVLYRHIDKDQVLLEQAGFSSSVVDIYPPRLNPWSNTHYHAFVAKKV